jgi:hypothetical protein
MVLKELKTTIDARLTKKGLNFKKMALDIGLTQAGKVICVIASLFCIIPDIGHKVYDIGSVLCKANYGNRVKHIVASC